MVIPPLHMSRFLPPSGLSKHRGIFRPMPLPIINERSLSSGKPNPLSPCSLVDKHECSLWPSYSILTRFLQHTNNLIDPCTATIWGLYVAINEVCHAKRNYKEQRFLSQSIQKKCYWESISFFIIFWNRLCTAHPVCIRVTLSIYVLPTSKIAFLVGRGDW